MKDSKTIDLEIEKLEKQQEELKKTLDLLKRSKRKIDQAEETKAENLLYKEVNELVAAANLKLYSNLGDLVRFTFNKKFRLIYLHESSVDPTKFSIDRFFLDSGSIEEISRWIDLILEKEDVLRYLLEFNHRDFTFESLDIYTNRSLIRAFFSSNDFHLHVDFFEDHNAKVSMSNYLGDEFRRVKINAGDITYFVELNDSYYEFSVSASIEKDCQFDKLDKVIEEIVAKLKNHCVQID